MNLYHGSTFHVRTPNVTRGRASVDFGQGFYTTLNIDQARRWALNKQQSSGGNSSAIVSVYRVDDNILEKEEYNIRRFDKANEEWLTFVVNCRRNVGHDYDIVYGPVANDRVYATITLFESGVLTAEATVAQLRVSEIFNQISFHTERAVNELHFLDSHIND
jgi:hypothetical protein